MHNTLSHPETLRSDATVNGVTTFDLGEPGAGRVKRPGLSR